MMISCLLQTNRHRQQNCKGSIGSIVERIATMKEELVQKKVDLVEATEACLDDAVESNDNEEPKKRNYDDIEVSLVGSNHGSSGYWDDLVKKH